MSLLVREARAAYEGMKFREALKSGFFDLQAARDAYRDMCEKLGVPPHGGCVRAFLETQAVVVAPIVPHWADAVWGGVLGGWARAPGPDGRPPSVLRAGWPALPPPDEGLLETDRYLTAKLHEFRLSLMRIAGVKASKVGKGAPPPPKPADVSIFVAAGWPAWQRRPLELLRGLWDPAAHAGTGGFPEDALKRVQDAAGKDAELKPFMKKIMPLASVTIAAMRGRAEPTPALALRLPFDERAVWADNAEYVRKALELPGTVRVLLADDARLAPGSATARALDPNNRVKEVTPGEPEVWPYATPEEVAAAAEAAGGAQ
jgi:leucyl-tRNA synthetase